MLSVMNILERGNNIVIGEITSEYYQRSNSMRRKLEVRIHWPTCEKTFVIHDFSKDSVSSHQTLNAAIHEWNLGLEAKEGE